MAINLGKKHPEWIS